MTRDMDWSILSWKQGLELDACVRCGECTNWCPVYEIEQREEVTPRGRSRSLRRLRGGEGGLLSRLVSGPPLSDDEFARLKEDLYQCTTCGQCHFVCPTGIDTMDLWESVRAVFAAAGEGPLPPHEALYRNIAEYDNPWQQPRSSRDRWAVRAAKGKNAEIAKVATAAPGTSEVLLFVGCTASFDMNLKQVAINTTKVLQKAGIDFSILGQAERCCGSTMRRVGMLDRFEERAKENIEQFNGLGIKTLVTSCSGCFKTIGRDYPKVGELDFEVLHVSQYLLRLLEEGALTLDTEVPLVVTYHDPCHFGRHAGVFEAPRKVLGQIPGLEFREMERIKENSRCCGAGGGVKAAYPGLQGSISHARIKEAEATGAEALVSTCPFCYQGLQVGMTGAGSALRMMDLTELVSAAIGGTSVDVAAAAQADGEGAVEVPTEVEAPSAAPSAAPSEAPVEG